MNQDDLIERATTIQKEILKWQTLLASASQTRRRQETATHSQLNVQQGMRSMIKLREIDSQHLQLKFLSKGRDDLESRVDLLQNEHRQSETTRINLLAELKVKEEVITSQEAEIREQRQQLEKILCCKRDTDQIQHLHTLITAIQTQHRSVQDEVALLKTEHGLSVKKLLTSRDLLKHSQERCKQLSERESEAMKLLSHKCAALANLQSSHAALRAEHDMVQMEKQMIEKKLAILMEEVKVERKAHADLEEALSHTKEANLKLLQNLQGAVESHNSSVERVKVENETMREKLDKLVGELYLQGRPKESMKMSSTTSAINSAETLKRCQEEQVNTKALPSGEVLPTKNLCAENCAGCNDPAYGLMVGLHKSIQLFCDNIFTRGVRVHVQVRCSGCFSTFHSLCVRRRSGHVGQSQQREFLCMSCHGNGTGND